jgi:hypothetical protein
VFGSEFCFWRTCWPIVPSSQHVPHERVIHDRDIPPSLKIALLNARPDVNGALNVSKKLTYRRRPHQRVGRRRWRQALNSTKNSP